MPIRSRHRPRGSQETSMKPTAGSLARLARLARWRSRKLTRRLRRRRRAVQVALAVPLGVSSLALFPVVLVVAASAALLHSGPPAARGPAGGPDRGIYATPRPADRLAAATPLGAPPSGAADATLRAYGATREKAARTRARLAAAHGAPTDLAALIHEIAVAAAIDPDLAFRLVRVESSFRPGVVGPAGGVGLTQIKPSTARWLDSTVRRDDLFEPRTNLRLGLRYLGLLLRRYDGDTRMALLAYNRGPGTVAALLALGKDPANGYASRILGEPRPRVD